MIADDLSHHAAAILDTCRDRQLRLAFAESCTGGLLAACFTAVPGSSDVIDRGFVTYTNEAKHEMLDVPEAMIAAHGAVSEPVARAMAEGALARSAADLAVSVTGIAGPGGATPHKPVGLVHIAVAGRRRDTLHERHRFSGDRTAVRRESVATALRLLERWIDLERKIC